MIISIVGCNAVGKSTAVRRYAARYPGLIAVSADTQLEIKNGEERRVREWKGTGEQKKALTLQHQARPGITVVESARTTHLEFLRPRSEIIIVTCEWHLYEKHMRARCLKRNKRFRDDYWTEWKLKYECSIRYLNYARKSLGGHSVYHFEIRDQAADWPAVDEQFGKLYRRMHNRMLALGNGVQA